MFLASSYNSGDIHASSRHRLANECADSSMCVHNQGASMRVETRPDRAGGSNTLQWKKRHLLESQSCGIRRASQPATVADDVLRKDSALYIQSARNLHLMRYVTFRTSTRPMTMSPRTISFSSAPTPRHRPTKLLPGTHLPTSPRPFPSNTSRSILSTATA